MVQEVHQLCDLALLLLKQISMRLTKGKPAEPAHFPGQVVLPKLIFRPNLQQREWLSSGGHHSRTCYAHFGFVLRLLLWLLVAS